ncbi:MAG TPA: phosphodiester glycosidase family protein [Beijerinckiaceae bacterium]|nr:phosphodiester glycosidase family protein [Beijerinckiaceae bacterium]
MRRNLWSRAKAAPLVSLIALIAVFGFGAMAALYAYAGVYGLNVVLRRGGTLWHATGPDDPALSPSMRLALRGDLPAVTAGPLAWRRVAEGFEVAELPVLLGGKAGDEVDRLLLTRVDPGRFRFEVHNRPAGDREPADWLRALGAVFVINGSYFGRKGEPDTPLKSRGAVLGPEEYDARHGAFVATDASAGVRDLAMESWREVLKGASDAMVSYPLLIGADGQPRVNANERWLANRSFVGEDRDGRIILGTTADAFFSLNRFAAFLRAAPLDLKLVLNLDGGPVACQGIALNGYTRDFCGFGETAVHDGVVKRLASVIPGRRWGLAIVLVAMPRNMTP